MLYSFLISFGIALEHVQVGANLLEVPIGPHRECEGGHYRLGLQGAAEPVLDDLHAFSKDLRMYVHLDVA